jgi:hypothetical protein
MPVEGNLCYVTLAWTLRTPLPLYAATSALRARGIRHAAVFGSIARGENRPDSDLDIVIEVDPEARMTVFDYVGLKEYVAGLFDGPFDVVSREGLKPRCTISCATST